MIKIAIFDFDKTITNCDTLLCFIIHTKGLCIFLLGFILLIPLIILYYLKIVDNSYLKQKCFSLFFRNTNLEQFENWCLEFSKPAKNKCKSKALNEIKHLNDCGYEIIIISASIENYVSLWGIDIGVKTTIGTQIEVIENKITGKFSSKNCYGIEKVNRLIAVLPDLTTNRSDYYILAYGDSRGDKELLEFADKSYYRKF